MRSGARKSGRAAAWRLRSGAESPGRRAGGGTRRFLDWRGVLGILISVAFLYFALRGVDAGEVLREIRGADPALFGLSVLAATLVFVVRAWRWKPLLEPVQPDLPFRPRFAATTIGFMANNLLPARVGEFARAYALSRMEGVPVTAAFGSLVVERLFDGVTIIVLLFATMALPSFPAVGPGGRDLSGMAAGLAVALGVLLLVLLATVIWPRPAVAAVERTVVRVLPARLRRPIVDALEAFLGGLGALREPRLLLQAGAWSLALWFLNALGFWLAMLAFDIDLPFAAALFLQSVVALAVSVPSAPGFFGLFEWGARVALVEVWAVEVNKTISFAIGFHMGGFVPVTLIGLYYVWRLGLSWREVEKSEEVVEEAVESGDAAGPG